MNSKSALSAASLIALTSCGSQMEPAPPRLSAQPFAGPPPGAAAAFTEYSVDDEVGKGFDYYASQIRDNRAAIEPGAANVSTAVSYINIPDRNTLVFVTPTGESLEFKIDTERARPNDTTFNYVSTQSGNTDTVFLRRYKHGAVFGSYRITELGAVSATRATFGYGWKTDPANFPAAQATFAGLGPSDIFFSDGHRVFDGSTNLVADFAAGKLTGTLFDNAHKRQEGLVVNVGLTNGLINSDGSISANNSMTMTIDDTAKPAAGAATVSETNLVGQFTGNEAIAIIGQYNGKVDFAGDALDFTGAFWAQNQDPKFGLGVRP